MAVRETKIDLMTARRPMVDRAFAESEDRLLGVAQAIERLGYQVFAGFHEETAGEPSKVKRVRKDGVVIETTERDVTVLDKAVWTEFGTSRFTGWGYMKISAREFGKEWARVGTAGFEQIVDAVSREPGANHSTLVRKAVTDLGLDMVSDVQNAINRIKTPGNAQRTKEAKGSDNPLINTAQMRQSVRWSAELGDGTVIK